MTSQRDLIVVGGGPAGSAAAITAASMGLRVTLIEALLFPRALPGETLHPGLEALFRQLGVWDGVAERASGTHRGIWLERDGEKSFQHYGEDENGPWAGLHIDRAVLDGLLIERARSAGVEILQPARIRDLSMSNRWHASTGAWQVQAPWLIDAAGGRHWLGRRLGMQPIFHSRPILARWWHESQSDKGDPELSWRAKGWRWRAPLGDGRVSFTALELQGGDNVICRRSNVTWRRLPRVSGEGWFMAGDAAGVLDPLSGKGVLRALRSGIHAGWLCAHSFNGKLAADHAMSDYETWFSGMFDDDLKHLYEIYRINLPMFT